MVRIAQVQYENEYRIRVRFDSGEEGVVDLHGIIRKYAAAVSLLDIEKFRQFELDEWPTLVWPCGFDLSPEFLYELVTGKRPVWQTSEMVHDAETEYR